MRRYQDVAFRVAYVVTGRAADAEDAAQAAFVKAFYALDRFDLDRVAADPVRDGGRSADPFRPWLLRIVANEARNRRVAAGRRPTLALSAAADRPSGDTALAPEAAALAGEQRRELLAALETLREDDRLVIAYRYFLDLSEAEMAAALGCARGTVKSRLSRALARLRERFPVAADVPTGGTGREAAGG